MTIIIIIIIITMMIMTMTMITTMMIITIMMMTMTIMMITITMTMMMITITMRSEGCSLHVVALLDSIWIDKLHRLSLPTGKWAQLPFFGPASHWNSLQDQTPSVSPAELLLSRETRRTLAQHRTNKSPLLVSYLFSIGDPRHPSPLCPLCLMHDHTSSHLFECKSLPTSLSSLDLWTNPDKVEPFLATWGERLLAAT